MGLSHHVGDIEMDLKEALELLRKESKKRKFDQTIDLFINLKGVDLRKDNINTVINIPHKVKEKKVCGFLTAKNDSVKTVTKPEFAKYKDKTLLRKLVDEFDFFIAHGSLMPAVATTFGKALGPAGKMPSPQLGIVLKETPEEINPLLERISKSVKVRAKEASIKVAAGKESMSDDDIIENVKAIYNGIVAALPTKKENVKNVKIKFTMSKTAEVEIK
jgi:large subunit ribosomal protein L1